MFEKKPVLGKACLRWMHLEECLKRKEPDNLALSMFITDQKGFGIREIRIPQRCKAPISVI